MPPTLVRPQTFTVFQQSDSASPAVRFQHVPQYAELNSASGTQLLLSTCCLDILPVRAFPNRTPYNQFSRCLIPTAWFSLFGIWLLSHTLKALLCKDLTKISCQICKQLNWRLAFPEARVRNSLPHFKSRLITQSESLHAEER